jgi:hypothetical protein
MKHRIRFYPNRFALASTAAIDDATIRECRHEIQ